MWRTLSNKLLFTAIFHRLIRAVWVFQIIYFVLKQNTSVVLLDVYVRVFLPVFYHVLQRHQVIRRVVRQIVKTAIRNDLIVDHIHNVRLQPSDFECYEPAVEMFHEKCFNLNKVWTMNAPLVCTVFLIVILCCCKPTTTSPTTTTLMITMLLCNVSYVQLCRFRFCLQLFIGSLVYVIGKFVTSACSLLAYFLTFLLLVIFSYLYYYSLQWILSRCFLLQVPNSCFIKWYHRNSINILMSYICVGVLYL